MINKLKKKKLKNRITENKHSIRKSSENGKEKAADDSRAEDLKQKLTAGGEIRRGEEHQITVHQD